MIDQNSQEQKPRPHSLFARLLAKGGALYAVPGGSKLSITDAVEPGASPISVGGEITDNSLLLEALLVEAADHLRINPYTTTTYLMLEMSKGDALSDHRGEPFPQYAHDGLEASLHSFYQMYLWLHEETLPPDFRCQFINFLIELDQLESIVAGLSQTRWERLRTWSCNRA